MDRDQFKKELTNATTITKYSIEEALKVIHDKTAPLQDTACSRDSRQKLITIEELCELAIEISRTLRGRGDMTGLLEEMADAHIILANIQRIHGISDEDISRAIRVKIENALHKLDTPEGDTKVLY